MRGVRNASSLFLLLSAAVAFADPPQITVPVEVRGEPGQFIQVPATTAGKTVSWKAVDSGLNLFPTDLLKSSHTAVVTAPKSGRYRLYAVTAAGDEVSAIVECVVVVGAVPVPPIPPTPPDPTPTPTPPAPVPGTKALYVWIVRDPLDVTPETASMLAEAAFRKALETGGHNLEVVRTGSQAIKDKKLQPFVDAAGGPPCVVLADAGSTPPGKVLKATRLPPTSTALIDLIHAVGGK